MNWKPKNGRQNEDVKHEREQLRPIRISFPIEERQRMSHLRPEVEKTEVGKGQADKKKSNRAAAQLRSSLDRGYAPFIHSFISDSEL